MDIVNNSVIWHGWLQFRLYHLECHVLFKNNVCRQFKNKLIGWKRRLTGPMDRIEIFWVKRLISETTVVTLSGGLEWIEWWAWSHRRDGHSVGFFEAFILLVYFRWIVFWVGTLYMTGKWQMTLFDECKYSGVPIKNPLDDPRHNETSDN